MTPRRLVEALEVSASGQAWALRVGAACVSLALHAGGLLGAVALFPTPPSYRPGIPALEVTLEMAAPPGEGQDGTSDADPQAATTAPAQAIPDEAPVAPDPPAIPDPDPAPVSRVEDPPEEPGKAEGHDTPALPALPAMEAALPGSPGAGQAALLDTANPGMADPGAARSAERDLRRWEKRLLVHLNRFKRYPDDASRPTGEVTLTFRLDRAGHLVSAAVRKSSGDPAYDQAALGMKLRSDPVPRPPAQVTREGLTFTVPVTFRTRKPGR